MAQGMREANRREIISAAASVLAAEQGASMAEVAAAAGIARATLYRYFPTRETLLRTLEAAANEQAGRRLAEANLDEVPVEEALARATRALVAVGSDFIVLLRERRPPEPGFTAPLTALIERGRDHPIQVSFTNELPDTYPAWIPVDTRLTPLGNQVRVMTHLHGGFVAGDSDGNPAVTPDGFGHGDTQTVYYTNQPPQMPAELLWFHDHGLGATRLNVFAGLAAAYIIRDQFDTGAEPNPIGIPGGAYEIPLVIQDRQFNADGTFLYPTSEFAGATWIGEYFGDVMLVNGKVWPFLNVEPRLYRLRILNGCNARILNLVIGGVQTLWQIGAEGGLWDKPVPVSSSCSPRPSGPTCWSTSAAWPARHRSCGTAGCRRRCPAQARR